MVIRLLSRQCSVSSSGGFLYSLVVIPDWPGEEVSVASAYSSAILDPLDFLGLGFKTSSSLLCFIIHCAF